MPLTTSVVGYSSNSWASFCAFCSIVT